MAFGLHLFSVKLLLKTLFSPWHRVQVAKIKPGFSLSNYFEQITFNTISRAVGFCVRSIFIFFGLILALFFFCLGLIIFLLWQILLPVSWIFYIFQGSQGPSKTDWASKEDIITLLQSDNNLKNFVFKRLVIEKQEDLTQIAKEDLEAVKQWYFFLKTFQEKNKHFWTKENLLKTPSFGSSLAFGYTNELDKYCQDLSLPTPFYHQLVGREKEIKQIQSVLNRAAQGNIMLIGEAGVGKHTILLGFARAIKEQRVDPSLFFKRVLKVDMNMLFGQSSILTSAKAKFSELLQEAEGAGNVILVIDQIEKYINASIGIDLTDVISPAALSSRINLIGITTPSNYERFIFPNEHLAKYFESVEVKSPIKEEAWTILTRILPDLEKGKKVYFSYAAAREIIDQADKLISNIPFPEKAIDLVDEILGENWPQNKKYILKQDVDELISQRIKIPVGILSKNETEKLKNLPQILHQRVVNQEEAINVLSASMQRARLQISEANKPMGAFLFLGPTGVGKTETAKAIAEAYFGSVDEIIRFDMSEFQNELALTALIGSSVTDKPGLLVTAIREKPFGVLLLDEFEKANKDILNLFLTVFDEGYLKDPNGKTVSFKNTIIICTSNAGAEFIRQRTSQNSPPTQEQLKTEVVEYVMQKNIFSPEMINRFDGVIVYAPLSPQHIAKVGQLLVAKLASRLKEKGITLQVEASVYAVLASEGYNIQFGARPMKRLIAQHIETLIAKDILDDKILKGNTIKLVVDQNGKDFRIEKATQSS